VVRRYLANGYDVTVEPSPHSVPGLPRSYQPDAVATRDGEVVVIEVKTGRPRRASRVLQDLRKAMLKHKKWRLDLVWAVPEPTRHAKAEAISPNELSKQFSEAEFLFRNGHRSAALLLLWSVLEAASRARLNQLGMERARPQSPSALISDLLAYGYVAPKERLRLEALASLRNAIAHGRADTAVNKVQFRALARVVGNLLEAPPAGSKKARKAA
jgi:hypothetical protein